MCMPTASKEWVSRCPPEIVLEHPAYPSSFRAVTSLARLLALCLAVFWLPLTMHCQLARLTDDCGATARCQHVCGDNTGGGDDCHCDACKTVESGNYFLKKSILPVPSAPANATPSVATVADRCLMAPVPILTAATGAPPGWNRVWQFACRAAPAPRAPAPQPC